MNDPIPLKSGRELQVGIASFVSASKLFKAVLAEVRTVELDLGKLDLTKLTMGAEIDLARIDPKLLGLIKNLVCEIASSETVDAAFWDCAGRSTIDGRKIDRTMFEAEDARQDFVPVAWEVIKTNLAPFFKGIDLSSLTSTRAPGPDLA